MIELTNIIKSTDTDEELELSDLVRILPDTW